MRVVFSIRFHTRFGQELFLKAMDPVAGLTDAAGLLPLRYKDSETWEAAVLWPEDADPVRPFTYNYLLREPDGSTVLDWGNDRTLDLHECKFGEVRVLDSWNSPAFYENAFYTEPFQQVLLRGMRTRVPPRVSVSNTEGLLCQFSVKAPLLSKSQTLCLLGNSPELGSWTANDPVLLGRRPGDTDCRVEIRLKSFPVEYKYGVFDLDTGKFIEFEGGGNRLLSRPDPKTDLMMARDGFAVLPSTTWKGAGVSVPVFSLRTKKGFGVGEFEDLKTMVDWCAVTGLQLIQLLPVNDTTATGSWRDSYPYAAISAFALHPIYLRLESVATTKRSRALLAGLEGERKRLNSLEAMDYEAVMALKGRFLQQVFPEENAGIQNRLDYREFIELNREWLFPYAMFCCFRDKHGTSDFSAWPACQRYNESEARRLAATLEFREPIELVYFIQYHLHKQLREAAAYAHNRGVVLKGDIPIGVYRCGADAWESPDLYHMETQAGAPPDAFAVKGQNWGFPTYNWEKMQQDGFAWWKQRFSHMSRYFDAFRIDHILGFFRIWSVPIDCVEGILGHFAPALPVHANEFQERGIRFDRARFTQPFINDAVLAELFGEAAQEAKERCLESDQFGCYRLKPEFATQHQVARVLCGPDPATAQLRDGLFELIANVILLDFDDTGDEFHFRFGMEETSSFRALPPEVQRPLMELYVDYFYRRQDPFWTREALKKLPSLKRVTNMLVCGEDLGMVPACVPQVMRDLGLLSLEIQRMPKESGKVFFNPKDAPYLSVVTPSTHDMSTIRGWWEEDPARTQQFYNSELGMEAPAPPKCDAKLNSAIVEQHLRSPAMWSIFMIQDLLGCDSELRHPDPQMERINVPAVPQHYWRYRMHISLEELLGSTSFNYFLRNAINEAGRLPVT